MATLAIDITKTNKRTDGTWPVTIRLTHNRKKRYISTGMYVSKADLTPSFKIKNRLILDRCEHLLQLYKDRLFKLNIELYDYSIDEIIQRLTATANTSAEISFVEWTNIFLEQRNIAKGTKVNYLTSLHAFQRFLGREEILVSDVTVKNLHAFAEYLGRTKDAANKYLVHIRTMFNAAKDYYNDEDRDIVVIKHSLDRLKLTRKTVVRKRAISIEEIRAIFALDSQKMKRKMPRIALDAFKLSFCLMGMNAVDLYNAVDYKDGVIRYERTKTKNGRADRAYIEVVVPDSIKDIFERYRDKTGERVFLYHKNYSDYGCLNHAIATGMKEISGIIGNEDLTFYAARHSMATIAINDVGIDKYTVHEMLNHVDQGTKITDVYIKKDFKRINEANAKLMAYVFGDMKI